LKKAILMSEIRYRVEPRSWDSIHRVASAYRQQLGVMNKEALPVVNLIEQVLSMQLDLFDFYVGSQGEMGDNYGLTDPGGGFIMIREDVYVAACDDQPRARWTMAHEWGHWALHAGRPLARTTAAARIKPFECAELQAHQFAAEILMPRQLITQSDTIETLTKRFLVSREAATRRMAFLQGRGLLRNE
jgi:Zn-dependent peptidase ImmA (M78 family)